MILREGKLLGTSARIPVFSLIFVKDHPANRNLRERFARMVGECAPGVLRIDERNAEYFREQEFLDHELAEMGARSVLIDGGFGIDEDRLAYHGSGYRTLLVVRSGETDLESYAVIKALVRRAGVKNLDVAVHGVDDPREGGRVFARLYETCERFLGIKIRYLGSVQNSALTEKNTDSGFAPEFLLDFEVGPALGTDLQALAKRWGLLP